MMPITPELTIYAYSAIWPSCVSTSLSMKPFNSSDLKMSLKILVSMVRIHLIDLPMKLWMSLKTRVRFSSGSRLINSHSLLMSDFLVLNENWSSTSMVVPLRIYFSRRPSMRFTNSKSRFSGLDEVSAEIEVMKLLKTITPMSMLQILMKISTKL